MPEKLHNQKRDFKGIWIPKEIWLNPNLSAIEKLLIVEVDSLDNEDDKGCFASNEYFGKFFGLSEGRIANMISSLKKRDFLFQVFFDGRNRGLRVHENVKAGFTKNGDRVHKNVKPDFTKRGKPVSRKREHNNTVSKPANNTNTTNENFVDGASEILIKSTTEIPGVTLVEKFDLEAEKEKAPPVAPPPPQPAPRWDAFDIDQAAQEFKGNQFSAENFARITGTPAAQMLDRFTAEVDVFVLEQKGKQTKYNRFDEFSSHFFNLARKKEEIKRNGKSSTQTRSTTTNFGSDESKFQQPQIF
jgi:hypothetical protein